MPVFFKKQYINIAGAFLICAIALAGAVFGLKMIKNGDIKIARAGSGDNVRGFAWSENYGWISFNSLGCDKNPEDTFIDTNAQTPGCGGNGDATTPANNYGVNIPPATGNFNGYAWSSNLGWIYFGGADVDLSAEGYGWLRASDGPAPNHWAKVDVDTGVVTGLARILSLGGDGWIKLSDSSWADGVVYNSADQEFTGWAYNSNPANTGMGWISFNSFNCDNSPEDGQSDGVGECPPGGTTIPAYGVYIPTGLNRVPTVVFDAMAYPGHCSSDPDCDSSACACGKPGNCVLNPQLTWTYNDPDGDSQDKYQIIFDDTDHLTGDLDAIIDAGGNSLPLKTGELPGSASSFYPAQNFPIFRDALIFYGQPYYSWIKVWDTRGADSGWVKFDDAADTDGDSNRYTFTTYSREFPDPYFDWNPKSFGIYQNILFTSQGLSKRYFDGSPGSAVSCTQGTCGWSWATSSNATINPLGRYASSTLIIFNSEPPPNQIITLTVSDGLYGCSTSTDLFPGATKLPTWVEVK